MFTVARLSLPGLVLVSLLAPAHAESVFTVSFGADYSEGRYGETEKTRSITLPFSVKYENGPVTLKASLPYVSTEGTANPDIGSGVVGRKLTETALSDPTVTGAYNIFTSEAGNFGVDLAGKVKFATTDKGKKLLTTGKNDYSIQADMFQVVGPIMLFGTLGWTKKGDPVGVKFRDPYYYGIGMSGKLTQETSWGVSYDYRQKVVSRGDPLKDVTLFASHKFSRQWKMQVYTVHGLTDASADRGAGFQVSYSFH